MTSERTLWTVVLMQAVRDATFVIKADNNSTCPPSVQHRAREWLTQRSRDFEIVCMFADIDAETARKATLAMRDSGWPRTQMAQIISSAGKRGAHRKRGLS